jgi:hypothetical protein
VTLADSLDGGAGTDTATETTFDQRDARCRAKAVGTAVIAPAIPELDGTLDLGKGD